MSYEYQRLVSVLWTGLLPDVGVRAVLSSCSAQYSIGLADAAATKARPSLHAELLASKHLSSSGAAQLVGRVDVALVTKVLRSDRRNTVLAAALERCVSVPVKLQRRLSKACSGSASESQFVRIVGLDPVAALQFLEKDLARVEEFPDLLWIAGHTGEWERVAPLVLHASDHVSPLVVEAVVAEFSELRSFLIERFAAGDFFPLLPVVAAHVSDEQRRLLVDVLVSRVEAGASRGELVHAVAVLCDDVRTPVVVRERLWGLTGLRSSLVFLGVPAPGLFPSVSEPGALSAQELDVVLARAGRTSWSVSRLSQLVWLTSAPLDEWQVLRLGASMCSVVNPYRSESWSSRVWLVPAAGRLNAGDHDTCKALGRLVLSSGSRADRWREASGSPSENVVLRDKGSAVPAGDEVRCGEPADGPIPTNPYLHNAWLRGVALLVERFGSDDVMWQFAVRLLPRFDGTFGQLADVVVASTRQQ